MEESFNNFLNNIETNFNYNDIDSYIHSFNEKYSNYIVPFYSKLLELIKKINNANIRIKKIITIRDIIKDISIDNYESYFLVIDITMLLGIEYYLLKNENNARLLFKDVINFGEKYNFYSKENFYDIINCAYSWLAYYSYNDKDYNKTIDYCNKVIDNYNEVKNDPNYYVTEKESVNICINYLNEIKKRDS